MHLNIFDVLPSLRGIVVRDLVKGIWRVGAKLDRPTIRFCLVLPPPLGCTFDEVGEVDVRAGRNREDGSLSRHHGKQEGSWKRLLVSFLLSCSTEVEDLE
ncbi:hypothetical protein BASA61_007316 [Batrachochytrium salamandrivorans]|nr:hypothetical protein BASA61_007316 [Batrachochytrium salamandrivorans]